MSVPVRNIYYMLLYAWHRLEEAAVVDVSTEDETSLLNLLSRVLVAGTRYLLKRGLDRGYISHAEDIRGIRGKIDFSATEKRQLRTNSKLHCVYDDLSYDVLHNRILKETICALVSNRLVDDSIRGGLSDLSRRISSVQSIALTSSLFSRVQLHRNNSFYGFLMSVCELIYHSYMIAEDAGDDKFRDFQRDKLMFQVFEDFIRNFYRIELEGKYDGYQVIGSEIIHWDNAVFSEKAEKYLPLMKTDVSIHTPNGHMIIDCKYYGKTLTDRWSSKLHSSHLYQLFSYLRNIEKKGLGYQNCAGMLLYPTVKDELNLSYEIQGNFIAVNTINLNMDWQEIHSALLNMVLSCATRRGAVA